MYICSILMILLSGLVTQKYGFRWSWNIEVIEKSNREISGDKNFPDAPSSSAWKKQKQTLRLTSKRKRAFFLKLARVLLFLFLIVPRVGIEPTLLAEPDFESGASTNSATEAGRTAKINNKLKIVSNSLLQFCEIAPDNFTFATTKQSNPCQ